jgi:hypothetical protein
MDGNVGWNAVIETRDHGLFNSFDRQPMLFPNAAGETTAVTPEKRSISGNLFFNRNFAWTAAKNITAGHLSSAKFVDLDDGSSSYNIENNVLVGGGIKINDGTGRTSAGNLILFADTVNPHYTVCQSIYSYSEGIPEIPGHNINELGYARSTDAFRENTVVSGGGYFIRWGYGGNVTNFPTFERQHYFCLTTNSSTAMHWTNTSPVSMCSTIPKDADGGVQSESNATLVPHSSPLLRFHAFTGMWYDSVMTLPEWQKHGLDTNATIASSFSDAAILSAARKLIQKY